LFLVVDCGWEIDQGAERLGYRDAEARCRLAALECVAVNSQLAVTAPIRGHGDVDARLPGCPQVPEVGSGAVARDGTFAACKDRGEVPAFATEASMTYGIDAAMDRMQPPGVPLARWIFAAHIAANVDLAWHHASFGARGLRRCAASHDSVTR
jgi:hypothetical protein